MRREVAIPLACLMRFAKTSCDQPLQKDAMKPKTQLFCALSILVASATACAQVTKIVIPPPNAFPDGTKVSGTLTFDNGLFYLSSWDVQVDRPVNPDFDYTPGNSSQDPSSVNNFPNAARVISLRSNDQQHFIQMYFTSDPFLNGCPGGICHPAGVLVTDSPGPDPTVTGVPEPSAIALASAGLALAGGIGMKRRRAARTIATACGGLTA
jgi:hypothetical protein